MRRLPIFVALSGLLLSAASLRAADGPPLSATALDGARFALDETSDKVVIVHFWATWCAPCRVEMPALDTYYRAHRNDGLAMIAISIDADGSRRKLLKATSAFAFPVARIADTRIARSAIPSALPETRIYGRDGVLRYDSAGRKGKPLDAATIAQIVAPLLAQSGAPTH